MLKKVKTKEKKRGQYIKRKADKAIAEQLTIDNLCVWKGFCLSAVFVCCCSCSGREILRSWFLSHTAAVIRCSLHPNQRNYNWGILYPAATFRCVSACENVEDRRNALGIWCRSFHLCDAKKVILKPYQKMEKQYTRNNIPRLLLLFIFFLACRLCEAKHDKWWDKTHLVHFCVMCVPWVIYCMSVRLGSVVIVNDPEVSAGYMQKSVFQTLASGSMFPLQYKLKVFLQCFRSACHVDLLIFIYLLIYLLHFSLYHFLSCLPFPCMSLNHLVCISLAV